MTQPPLPEYSHPQSPRWARRVRSAVYLIIVFLLAYFLFHLGGEPWILAAGQWQVLLGLMITIGGGLIVQAKSFQVVAPPAICVLTLGRLVHIWATSAVVSVVAPLFVSLATRTALLMRSGMPLSACLTTTTRQIWMGLELAFLLAAGSLPFVGIQNSHFLAMGAAAAWLSMLTIRLATAKGVSTQGPSSARMRRFLSAIGQRVSPRAYAWYAIQIVLMALTYYLGFAGFGAPLSWADAIALSSATVALSLIIFVPNGLGITDALWVLVATKSGLHLEGAVALAIAMRISHLIAASLLALITVRRQSSDRKSATASNAG